MELVLRWYVGREEESTGRFDRGVLLLKRRWAGSCGGLGFWVDWIWNCFGFKD